MNRKATFVIRRPFKLATRKHPRRIAINQNSKQNLRMIRCRTRAAIAAAHCPQIQSFDNLDNKTCKVLLGKPFIHRRRKKKAGRTIYHSKVAHRTTAYRAGEPIAPFKHISLACAKSDRLLGV